MRRTLIATALSVTVHLVLFVSIWTVWHRHRPETPVDRLLPLRLTHLASAGGRIDHPPRPPASPATKPHTEKQVESAAKPRPATTDNPRPKRKPQPTRPTPRPRPKAVFTEPAPIEQPRPESPPPPVAEPEAPPPAPTPRPASSTTRGRSGGEARVADFRAALQQGIERNKRYPLRERRRRHQGRSVVAFTLHRNGDISDIRIVTGSGHPGLDRAAVSAVEKIDGQFPIPPELARESWQFTVPVIYRLQ